MVTLKRLLDGRLSVVCSLRVSGFHLQPDHSTPLLHGDSKNILKYKLMCYFSGDLLIVTSSKFNQDGRRGGSLV